jgi:hypothetical protein
VAAQLPGLVAAAGFVAVSAALLALTSHGRTRSQEGTLRLLGEAVAAGLASAGHVDLANATVTATATEDTVTTAVYGVDDDTAQLWADAFDELMGPLGTPRWLLAAGDHTWRVPGAASATKAEAMAFAHAFRRQVPGTRLIRAGTQEATERTLRAILEHRDEIVHTLRWTPSLN